MSSDKTPKKDPGLSQRSLFAVAVLFGALTVLPFLDQFGVAGPHEEGLMTSPSMRLFQGEVPYRDFSTRPNPGTYYCLYLLYALISPTVTAARFLVVLLGAIMAGCLQRLGSRFLPGLWSLFPVGLFCLTGITHFPVVNHHWLGIASFLFGLLLLVRWHENPGYGRAAQLGAAVAICWWFLQIDGGVLGLTVLLYAFLRRPQGWLKQLGVMAPAFLGASLLLWSHVLVHVSPDELFRQSVVEPLSFHVDINKVSYDWGEVLGPHWSSFRSGWQHFSWTGPAVRWLGHSLSYLGVWFVKYGLYYWVLFGALAGLAVRRRTVSASFLVVYGGVWLSTLIQGRQDLLYLNYLNTGWYLILTWLIYEFVPVKRVFAGLLLALFSTQFFFGWYDSRAYIHPIQTYRGTYYSNNFQEALFYQQFYQLAMKLTPPGSYTLAYPYFPSFYFLTGTRNVSRPPIAVPVNYPEEIVTEDIVPRLEELKPQYLYRVPMTEQSLKDYPGADPEEFLSLLAQWDAEILADYELFQDLGVVQIYRRAGANSPAPAQPTPEPLE